MANNKTENHWLVKAISPWLDLVAKVISAGAILVAGWWAYRQFTVHRVEAQNLMVSLSPAIHGIADGEPLMIVDVTLKNIGVVPIWAGERGGDSPGKGCELTVMEYSRISKRSCSRQSVIDWTEGIGKTKYLVKKYNLLEGYVSYQQGSYMLNPGIEYHESGAVPVKKGKLYGVRVRFFSQEGWTAADVKYVYVPKSGP